MDFPYPPSHPHVCLRRGLFDIKGLLQPTMSATQGIWMYCVVRFLMHPHVIPPNSTGVWITTFKRFATVNDVELEFVITLLL